MARRHCVAQRRRAATAITVCVFLPVIFGFAALTVDVGVLYNTRADLQNAADAAAMAAAHTYATTAAMQMRMGMWSNLADVQQYAITQARRVTDESPLFGSNFVKISDADVTLGWIDITSSVSPLATNVPPSAFNAVHVFARRTSDSPNGAAELFFSGVFGKHLTNVTASAVAAFDDRFAGLNASETRVFLWPFTKNIINYELQLTTGGDNYSYDPQTQTVDDGPDGTREVILFPGDEAPGNYGMLNIGVPDLSADEISLQIENGITTADLETTFGTAELMFFDVSGDPTPYMVSGNSGLKSMVEPAIQLAIGDFVGFFVHDLVSGSGSNTVYRIMGVRFGRVMHVSLQTSSLSRGLWVQPTTYDGPGVITFAAAPSSLGAAGKIILAR